MKTYTLEEYQGQKRWKGVKKPNPDCTWGDYSDCRCISFKNPGFVMSAFKDCPNCFGYGIPPIPWSEVNK